jgi:hypothetical protein
MSTKEKDYPNVTGSSCGGMSVQDLILVNHFISDVINHPKQYVDYEATVFQVTSQCDKLSEVLDDPDYGIIAKRVWNFVLKYPERYTYPKD